MRYFLLSIAMSIASMAQAKDPVLEVSPHDTTMLEAVTEARYYLDLAFRTAHLGDGAFHQSLSLKVAFPSAHDSSKHEIIWVEGIEMISQGHFQGTLANQPVTLGEWTIGDRVPFGHDQIKDWSLYVAEGQNYGHFTTQVILHQMPISQAEPIWAAIGRESIPPSW